MNYIELAKIIKEIGLAAGAFGLCTWMVIYIVRKLGSNIEKMITKQEIFMDRVRAEHEAAQEDHKEFAIQNKEITAALGRINGYKNDRRS